MMQYPSDWPSPEGDIDLDVHDLPHDSSALEWWYVHAHLEAGSRTFSLFASFFRSRMEGDDDSARAHSLTWALVDLDEHAYYPGSLLDPRTPEQALRRLDRPGEVRDPLLRRAMRELFESDQVPSPDTLLPAPGTCATDRLALDYGGQTFEKRPDGTYALSLHSLEHDVAVDVVFTLGKKVVRHGDRGVVRGVEKEEMFYYFCPRCEVDGSVRVGDESLTLTAGSGWYDHEFGRELDDPDASDASPWVGWNWLAAQLDGGWEISAYDLFAEEESDKRGHWLIVIDPEGNRRAFETFRFEPLRTWTSAQTFATYPVSWRVVCEEAKLDIIIEPAFDSQEFMTIMSRPGFWEGRVQIHGALDGRDVHGPGFVERRGPDPARTLRGFFGAVGAQTRRAISSLVPAKPDDSELARLTFGGPDGARFLDGVDREQVARAALGPIRAIVERGGKSWRSYGLLACCAAAGGDPQPFIDWLAVPELLHTGSLLVDDVQDGSDVRRGGPAAHVLFGDALAINSGCLAYFVGQLLDYDAPLTPTQRLSIYQYYFEALRAGHIGQSLDIDGIDPLDTDDADLLKRRVLATHRLKSGAPVGAVGRIGATLGHATKAQVHALGQYLEQLGLAFQVVDDVLNLRGFEKNLKTRGEDLLHQKITYPVAAALGLLGAQDRAWLLERMRAPEPPTQDLSDMLAMIEGCGALDEADALARDMVESAWAVLAATLEPSQASVKLRAFGWFVLDRQY